jgi:hypothetical protein
MPKVQTKSVIDNIVRQYASIDAQIKLLEVSKSTLRNRVIEWMKSHRTNEWNVDTVTVKLVTAETLKFNDEAMAELLGRRFNDISDRTTNREKFKSAMVLGRFDGIDFSNAINKVATDKLLVDGKSTGKLSFVVE